MNHIIKNKLMDFKWDVFPNSVWALSQGGPVPFDIVLCHVNAVVRKGGQGTMDAKIEALHEVEKVILNRRWLTRWMPWVILRKISVMHRAWVRMENRRYSLPWFVNKGVLCIKEHGCRMSYQL